MNKKHEHGPFHEMIGELEIGKLPGNEMLCFPALGIQPVKKDLHYIKCHIESPPHLRRERRSQTSGETTLINVSFHAQVPNLKSIAHFRRKVVFRLTFQNNASNQSNSLYKRMRIHLRFHLTVRALKRKKRRTGLNPLFYSR